MRWFVYILLVLLVACGPGDDDVYNEKIVVEGYIELGEVPVVRLSKSLWVPPGVDREVEAVQKIPIRWAKVTVTHDGVEEILVGRRDRDHILGWRYEGEGVITGARGGEYTLTVEYSGYTLTAVTTIPAEAPARLGEISVRESGEGETYTVNASLTGVSAAGYYMLMAKIGSGEDGGGGVYNPCVFGTVEGAALDQGVASVTVFRPMAMKTEENEPYTPVFRPGERVMLRVASVDGEAFGFWSAFMNDVLNAHNPVYPSSANLPSNVRGGGLGVWFGFAASYGEVEVPD